MRWHMAMGRNLNRRLTLNGLEWHNERRWVSVELWPLESSLETLPESRLVAAGDWDSREKGSHRDVPRLTHYQVRANTKDNTKYKWFSRSNKVKFNPKSSKLLSSWAINDNKTDEAISKIFAFVNTECRWWWLQEWLQRMSELWTSA